MLNIRGRFVILFRDGTAHATDPSSDPAAQLNGGVWGVGAFEKIDDLQNLTGRLRPVSFVLPFRYAKVQLSITQPLLLNVAASSFLEGQKQTQVYEGEFRLAWTMSRIPFLSRIWLLLGRLFGRPPSSRRGVAVIKNAKVSLEYNPVPDAAISGTLIGTFDGSIPWVENPIIGQFSSQGPAQPGATEFTFPVDGLRLFGGYKR